MVPGNKTCVTYGRVMNRCLLTHAEISLFGQMQVMMGITWPQPRKSSGAEQWPFKMGFGELQITLQRFSEVGGRNKMGPPHGQTNSPQTRTGWRGWERTRPPSRLIARFRTRPSLARPPGSFSSTQPTGIRWTPLSLTPSPPAGAVQNLTYLLQTARTPSAMRHRQLRPCFVSASI